MLLRRRKKNANLFFVLIDHHVWIIPSNKFAKHFRVFNNIWFTNLLLDTVQKSFNPLPCPFIIEYIG